MTVLCFSDPARAEGRLGTSLHRQDEKTSQRRAFLRPPVGAALEAHAGAAGLRQPCVHSHPIPSHRPVCLCKCHCSQLWSTGLPAQQALGSGLRKQCHLFAKSFSELWDFRAFFFLGVGCVFVVVFEGVVWVCLFLERLLMVGCFCFGLDIWGFFKRSITSPMRSTNWISCFLKEQIFLILGLTKLQSSLWLVFVQHVNFWMIGTSPMTPQATSHELVRLHCCCANLFNGFSMYQENSRQLFLSHFPSQSLFSPLLFIGRWPLFMEKESNFHSGTQWHVAGLHVMVALPWLPLIETAGEFSYKELICLPIWDIVTAIEEKGITWFSEILLLKILDWSD